MHLQKSFLIITFHLWIAIVNSVHDKKTVPQRNCSKEEKPPNGGLLKSYTLDFLDLRGFTLPVAQIIQLCATDFTMADQFHMIHSRRMDRESPLHTDSVRNPTNRKGFPNSAVPLGDHSAFKSLKTFSASFNNLDPHTNRVANIDLRKIGSDLLSFDRANNLVHFSASFPLRRSYTFAVHPNGKTSHKGQRTARITWL